jgi:signal transduction histidine kinase
MAGGDFIKKPDRRLKLLILIQGLWAVTLMVLALWWVTLLSQQGGEIANLQTQLGVPATEVQSRLDKTTRMVEGESSAFILLIIVTNGILLFFYARDTRRSRSLEAFFASITHELRTPLTSIRLQAEALRDIEDNPSHAPYLHRLLEDVGRLEGQVQQTLELARIEGGGLLNLKPVRIRNFVVNKIIPQYTLDESRLVFESSMDEAFLQADPAALHMILRNLIDNAIKYSASGPTRITLTGRTTGRLYTLSVVHENSLFSGDPKKLGSLFYRGPESQGAGVGLYLIRSLMKRMQGSASFDPAPPTFSTELQFQLESGEAVDVG